MVAFFSWVSCINTTFSSSASGEYRSVILSEMLHIQEYNTFIHERQLSWLYFLHKVIFPSIIFQYFVLQNKRLSLILFHCRKSVVVILFSCYNARTTSTTLSLSLKALVWIRQACVSQQFFF